MYVSTKAIRIYNIFVLDISSVNKVIEVIILS